MKIDRNNYEMYVMDYLEGTLSEEMEQAMRIFLSANPDIAAELEGISDITLNDEVMPSQSWNHLLKTDLDNEEVFEDVCIASVEKQNSEAIESELAEYLNANPSKQHDYALYQKTILKVDTSIRFFGKESLMKKSFRIHPALYIAASIISVAIILFVSGNRTAPVNLLASVEPLKVELEQPTIRIDRSEFSSEMMLERHVENQYGSKAVAEVATREEQLLVPMQTIIAEVITYNEPEVFALVDMSGSSSPIELTIEKELLADNSGDDTVNSLKDAIADKGFTFLKQVSNDRIDYTRGKNGKIASIEYSSRMLALSIPIKSK